MSEKEDIENKDLSKSLGEGKYLSCLNSIKEDRKSLPALFWHCVCAN